MGTNDSHAAQNGCATGGSPVSLRRISNTLRPPSGPSQRRLEMRALTASMLHKALEEGSLSSERAADRLDVSAELVNMKRRGERTLEVADILMLGPKEGLRLLSDLQSVLVDKIVGGLTLEQAALRWSEKAAKAQAVISASLANDGKIDPKEDVEVRRSLTEVSDAERLYKKVSG